MKKAIVLLLALAMVAMAFAQPAADITGYGQVTWGYNLNNNMHGFTNAYGLTVNVPLVDGASKAVTGEGNYGKASVTELTINLLLEAIDGVAAFEASDATVSAAIVTGPLTTTIYSKPSLKQNNANHFSPWKDTDADYSNNGLYFSPAVGGGLTFAYSLGEMGSVTGKLASIGDATTYASDQYAVAGGLTLTPAKIVTIAAGGAFDLGTSNAGGTVKVSLAPADGITAYVAADLVLPSGGTMTYDGRFNVAAVFGKTTVSADAYYADNGTVTTLDGALKVVDSGTVAGLTASAAVYAMGLLADPANDPMLLGVADSIAYKISLSDKTYVTPYQKAAFDMSKASDKLYLSIGANAVLIANTTFTVDFTAGSMTNKAFPGAGFVATGTETDKGKLTLKAKVAF